MKQSNKTRSGQPKSRQITTSGGRPKSQSSAPVGCTHRTTAQHAPSSLDLGSLDFGFLNEPTATDYAEYLAISQ